MTGDTRSLTGLRFFAAAGIVIHHSDKGVFFTGDLVAPFSFKSGVPLFFALSGFVLAIHAAKYKADLGSYFVARAARIWPAHLATIALLVFVFWPYSQVLFAPPHLTASALNILLIQSWFPSQAIFSSLNAPSWSVSCELFFYAMFPFLVVWMRQSAIIKSASFFFGAIIATYILSLIFSGGDGVLNTWLGYTNPVINLPTFMLGIAAGLYYVDHPPKPSHSATLIQCGAIAVLVLSMWIAGLLAHGANSALGRYIQTSGPAPAFALLLLVLAKYYTGHISRFLSARIFVYLGEISYSIYLTHQIIFRWWADRRALFDGYPIAVQYIGALVVVLLVSALIYHAIEKPGRYWIVRLWKSRRRSAAAAA